MLQQAIIWSVSDKEGNPPSGIMLRQSDDDNSIEFKSWPEDKLGKPPTVEEQRKILSDYKAYIKSLEYRDLRKASYLPIPDQLDLMYWDKVNGTDSWKEHVESVKVRYPKP